MLNLEESAVGASSDKRQWIHEVPEYRPCHFRVSKYTCFTARVHDAGSSTLTAKILATLRIDGVQRNESPASEREKRLHVGRGEKRSSIRRVLRGAA